MLHYYMLIRVHVCARARVRECARTRRCELCLPWVATPHRQMPGSIRVNHISRLFFSPDNDVPTACVTRDKLAACGTTNATTRLTCWQAAFSAMAANRSAVGGCAARLVHAVRWVKLPATAASALSRVGAEGHGSLVPTAAGAAAVARGTNFLTGACAVEAGRCAGAVRGRRARLGEGGAWGSTGSGGARPMDGPGSGPRERGARGRHQRLLTRRNEARRRVLWVVGAMHDVAAAVAALGGGAEGQGGSGVVAGG